jgi:hypothetical protein
LVALKSGFGMAKAIEYKQELVKSPRFSVDDSRTFGPGAIANPG